MAKRNTGVGSKNKNKRSPHKTAKRLAAKSIMLQEKAAKKRSK